MKYRKKPVVIEAEQFLATKDSWDKIMALGVLHNQWEPGEMGSETFHIKTLNGYVKVAKGEYICKGVRGEFYPCAPDIFEETYEKLEADDYDR